MYAEARFPVRSGEHACSHFTLLSDRSRLASAFARDGLRRGNRVVYLCDDDPARLIATLTADDGLMESALAEGQIVVRAARPAYLPDGRFEVDRALRLLRDEAARALNLGHSGLSIMSEMGWVVSRPPGHERLGDYTRRVAEVLLGTEILALSQYDHARLGLSSMALIAGTCTVDFPAELAPIGRDDDLAAAIAGSHRTLRLAGDLGAASATALADVIAAHFHGPLRVDLADITAADARGLHALRGHFQDTLTLVAASEPVRRLAAVFGWDSDPRITILDAA